MNTIESREYDTFYYYLIPAAAIVWFVWRKRHPVRLLPPAAASTPPQPKAWSYGRGEATAASHRTFSSI